MKKPFITLVVGISLLTFSSCKKWFNCICTSAGTVQWSGSVQAVTKAKAESIVQADCNGQAVSCN